MLCQKRRLQQFRLLVLVRRLRSLLRVQLWRLRVLQR
jgi:hypothetical protein